MRTAELYRWVLAKTATLDPTDPEVDALVELVRAIQAETIDGLIQTLRNDSDLNRYEIETVDRCVGILLAVKYVRCGDEY